MNRLCSIAAIFLTFVVFVLIALVAVAQYIADPRIEFTANSLPIRATVVRLSDNKLMRDNVVCGEVVSAPPGTYRLTIESHFLLEGVDMEAIVSWTSPCKVPLEDLPFVGRLRLEEAPELPPDSTLPDLTFTKYGASEPSPFSALSRFPNGDYAIGPGEYAVQLRGIEIASFSILAGQEISIQLPIAHVAELATARDELNREHQSLMAQIEEAIAAIGQTSDRLRKARQLVTTYNSQLTTERSHKRRDDRVRNKMRETLNRLKFSYKGKHHEQLAKELGL